MISGRRIQTYTIVYGMAMRRKNLFVVVVANTFRFKIHSKLSLFFFLLASSSYELLWGTAKQCFSVKNFLRCYLPVADRTRLTVLCFIY